MSDSPLLDAWFRARQLARRPLQIPGHKNRYVSADSAAPGSDILTPLIRDDLPLQGGADDNAFSEKLLVQAEKLWASAVGAEHARFLVGGSSQGNISALTAVAKPGEHVLVDRTSHRSLHAALVVSGALPTWVLPEIHPEFGIPVGMPVIRIEDQCADHVAVFVTSPSYVGTLSDVAALARVTHDQGSVLIIDQAWGAHLDFLPGGGAIACGADIATTSVHKTLLGYSQTAVTTLGGNRIDVARLDRAVDLTATTSPSATLLASIEATRVVMAGEGGPALDRAIELTAGMRSKLVVLTEANAGCQLDPLKVTLWLPRAGVDGVALGAALWECGHGVEAADSDTLVITMSLADDETFFTEVTDTISSVIGSLRGPSRAPTPAAMWRVTPIVAMTPRDAFFAPRRRVPLNQAEGLISAEQFTPYPPGVPLIAPGEQITQEIIEAIALAGRSTRVAYASDPDLRTVEVVAS
jgi:arginine decarboxylase